MAILASIGVIAVLAAACGTMGARSNPDETFARTVRGEVVRVDERLGEIVVATEGGNDAIVRVNSNTPVRYRGQDYRPVNLDPGDLVIIHLTNDSSASRMQADWIEVQQSVQERRGTTDSRTEPYGRDPRDTTTGNEGTWGRDDRGSTSGDRQGAYGSDSRSFVGTVDWVDERQGAFGLRTASGTTVRVMIPFNAPTDMRSRLTGLRRGDEVRIMAVQRERDRLELVRFD